jgi:hypothetical protein
MSIHKWEVEGLGKAPFKVNGIWEMPSREWMANYPENWNEMLKNLPFTVGSCKYCYTALSIHYIIKDANGKLFTVGSECVKKSGDDGLTSVVHEIKLARDRKLREEKRNKEREEKLQAQREKNDGLTDYELTEKKWADDQKIKQEALAPVISLLGSIADTLEDGNGGFRSSVAKGLREGKLPYGNGRSIMLEILAKQAGRKNSIKYNAAYDVVNAVIEKAELMISKV